MAWVTMDDRFPENEKVAPLSAYAFRLHVTAICHANRNLTDGRVSPTALRVLLASSSATTKHVAELVSAGLWDEAFDGGHQIHDYLAWNKSRSTIENQRAAATERKRKQRERDDNDSSVTSDVTRDGPRESRTPPPHHTNTTPQDLPRAVDSGRRELPNGPEEKRTSGGGLEAVGDIIARMREHEAA